MFLQVRPKRAKHAPYCEEKAFWARIKVGRLISSLLSFYFLLSKSNTGGVLHAPAGSGNLQPRGITIRNNKFNK